MPWIHSRALRSGYILRQLAAGTPLPEVQSRVGHRQVTTTRRYLGMLGTSGQLPVALRRTCGVLIVDAILQARRRLRAILESTGHQVFEASDVVCAHDMLRLSRLSLVVLVAASKRAWSDIEVLEKGSDGGQHLADYRIILIVPQRERVPEQLADPVASSKILVISRPIYYKTLQALIAQAYSELGAQNERLEDENVQHP
jgi:DNA-binding NtrC family response regulator